MRAKLPEKHVVVIDFEVYCNGQPYRYMQVTYTYQTKTAYKLVEDIKAYAEEHVQNYNTNTDSIRITNVMRLT